MASVKMVLVFTLGLNTLKCQTIEDILYIPSTKLNGQIDLETIEVFSTAPTYLDNGRGSDRAAYLEAEINELGPVTPGGAQSGPLSEFLTSADAGTSVDSLEKNATRLPDTPQLAVENLLIDKPMRNLDTKMPKKLEENELLMKDFGNNMFQSSFEEEIEDLNSFLKLDQNLQESIEKTTQPDLSGDLVDVASILSDEGVTEDYETTIDVDDKINKVIDILSKNSNKKSEKSSSNKEETDSFETTLPTFEGTTEKINETTKKIEDIEENVADISTEKTDIFFIGKNDFNVTSSEVEDFYNKILQNNDEDSEENEYFDENPQEVSSVSTSTEKLKIKDPDDVEENEDFGEKKTVVIATTEKVKIENNDVLPVKPNIFGNIANFTICILEKNGIRFWVPYNADFKQTENEIIISWKSQENHLNNALLLKTIDTDKYYAITRIELALVKDKRLIITRKNVVLEPSEANTKKLVVMDDGTEVLFSSLDFLKKSFETPDNSEDIWDNQMKLERIWKMEILAISIFLTVILAALVYFLVYKIKKRVQFRQKTEVEVSKC